MNEPCANCLYDGRGYVFNPPGGTCPACGCYKWKAEDKSSACIQWDGGQTIVDWNRIPPMTVDGELVTTVTELENALERKILRVKAQSRPNWWRRFKGGFAGFGHGKERCS